MLDFYNYIKELKDQITDSQIKDILSQFNVFPIRETVDFIVFPTCCHNLTGGSPKLYYYKNTHLFKCYTECDCLYDIFRLIIKMYKLRDKQITFKDALKICGIEENEDYNLPDTDNVDIWQDIKILAEMKSYDIIMKETPVLKAYPPQILNRFPFNFEGVKTWLNENISLNAILRFNIRYDSIRNCIVIPNYDIDGRLIGVRGRFLENDATAKYAPLFYEGQPLSHPTAQSFYGIYENKNNIINDKMVFIFEGEKSVLHFDTIYGSTNNNSLATLGKGISLYQINLLKKLNVETVILCYDADYEDYKQLDNKEQEYTNIAKMLCPYFDTYILMDYDFLLEYKDSPIDRGKEIFENILANRVKVMI